jgi:hypothetical protein
VRLLSLDNERKPGSIMTAPTAHLACPQCGCTYFEEKIVRYRFVSLILTAVQGEKCEILKNEAEPDDDPPIYYCGGYCGFETDDIENDATLSIEYVDA